MQICMRYFTVCRDSWIYEPSPVYDLSLAALRADTKAEYLTCIYVTLAHDFSVLFEVLRRTSSS